MRKATVVVSTVLLTATACGSGTPDASSTVAERFYQAIQAKDGGTACSLLAPKTAQEVEESGQASCDTAILDEDIPDGGTVTDLHQYGGQAQVRLRGDTAFLAEFDDGWKIVAAACTPQGEQPYDCKLKG
ncbi:hypothetical protein [Kribbella lupini]|uniref:Subtilisin inhibitor-like n=1 Tax=Kribbella lupini TaxID=291602 RepID=A0ABN2AKQ3_9ACTN